MLGDMEEARRWQEQELRSQEAEQQEQEAKDESQEQEADGDKQRRTNKVTADKKTLKIHPLEVRESSISYLGFPQMTTKILIFKWFH